MARSARTTNRVRTLAGLVQGESYAHRDREPVLGDTHGLGYLLGYLCGYGGQVLRATQAGQEHDELVTPHPGDEVGFTNSGAEPLGDDPQRLIADAVTHRVVDGLEVVEVDVGDSRGVAVTLGARELALELLGEQEAVGEPGQVVVVGEVADHLFGVHAVGDVADGRDARADRASSRAPSRAPRGRSPRRPAARRAP